MACFAVSRNRGPAGTLGEETGVKILSTLPVKPWAAFSPMPEFAHGFFNEGPVEKNAQAAASSFPLFIPDNGTAFHFQNRVEKLLDGRRRNI
ncbi:hypothetical protein [Akkermansia sp.]|uniref:hypothetical protein n=1 Tax=Akkermansia sp. TaxID=1872421 RepID=UPI0025C2EDB6|nr:hypothetical protein [Akkermansia sp.]